MFTNDPSMDTYTTNIDEYDARNHPPRLAIVVPCYNESEVIESSTKILYDHLNSLINSDRVASDSIILLVDDGSHDDTWAKIEKLSHYYTSTAEATGLARVHGIKFAHNQGHQFAVFAGLMEARSRNCDATVSIDADLQDDPFAIDAMIKEYMKGAEIVYGVRNNRDTDTIFKRSTANAFYGLMNLLGAHTIPHHADFRLMGRQALEALSQYNEINLFLRGVTAQLGFSTACVYYKRAERTAGESKYPLKKMIAFALDGITSFSIQPIRFISWLGLLAFISGVGMVIYTFASVFTGHAISGWASLMASLWVLGGAILIGIGVIGEYIAKIYMEVKRRPRYFIEKRV